MSTYTPEAFILKNQLVVTDTTDATNGTSGAFVITGGASVSKNLIVSGDQTVAGQAIVNNVNITPNANDIIYEKQAVLSSDVNTFTDISGFYFLDTVASAFKAYITVIVTGPTNKYAFWELNSVYTPTGWAYTSSFTGDITGVNFNIDVTGGTAKVQYTNSNGAGYSTIIRYRAQTTAPAGSSPTGGTGLFNSTTNNYVTNTLLYANSSDTVASAGDITFSNNVLNVGGATKLQVSKTTDAANLSSAAFVVDGGASISKRLLVGTRVGINNTNPSYNLDIGGDININGNIYQNGSIYSGSSLWAGNSLQNYYINPTGSFVGIGTTNPSTNLEVSGGLKATSATVSSLMASGANVTNLSVTNITLGSITPTSISTGSLSTPAVVSTNATLGSLNVDNFEFKNMTIASSLIPNANVTYDLGSSSRRWRDLYLSGNTIHLGDSVTISSSTSGNISITSAGDGVFTAAIISSGSVYTNSITSGSLTASDISSTNIQSTAVSASNVVVSSAISASTVVATTITSANVKATDATIGNINASSYTGSSMVLSGDISAGTVIGTLVSGGSIGVSGATIGNVFSTVVSSGSIQVSGNFSAASVATSSVSAGNMSSANATIGNIISTSLSASTLNASGSITTGGLLASSISSTDATATNATIATLSSSTISSGTVYVSGTMSAGTVVSNLVTSASIAAVGATIGTLYSSTITSNNLSAVNSSIGTLNASGITVGNINFTGSLYKNGETYISSQWTTNGSDVSYTSGNVQATLVSTGSVAAAGASVGTLYASTITVGNLYVSGYTISMNVTSVNLIQTNISTGNINSSFITTASLGAAGITVGSLYAGSVSSTNVSSTNATFGSVIATNASIGTLRLSNTYGIDFASNIGNQQIAFADLPNNFFGIGANNSAMQYQAGISSVHRFYTNASRGTANGALGTLIASITSTGISTSNAQMTGTLSAGTLVGSLVSAGSMGAADARLSNISAGSLIMNGDITLPTSKMISMAPHDNFQYSSNTVGHYSLAWNVDASSTSIGNMAYLASYGGIRFFSNGLPRMVVGFGGNVGINTTSPSYTLDVAGTIGGTTFVGTNTVVTNATFGTLLATLASAGSMGAAGITTGTLYATNATATSATIGTLLATLASAGSMGAAGITAGTLYAGLVSSTNAVVTNATFGTLLATLASAGSMGAAGITVGTLYVNTITGSSLQLSGNINLGGSVTATDSILVNGTSNLYANNLWVNGSLIQNNRWVLSGDNTLLSGDANANLIVGKSSVAKSLIAAHSSNTLGNIITTNGNVGINTASPSYTLDVAGTIGGTAFVGTNTVVTNATFGTILATLASAGSMGAAGITAGTLYATNATATSATIGTILATLASAGSMGAAGITTGTLYATNAVATSATIGTILATLASAGSMGAAGITVGTLYATNAVATNVSATSATIGTILATLASAGSMGAAGITAGTLYATNATATSATIGTILATLASAGSMGASGITTGTLYSTNATATNATIASVSSTNITTSNIHTDAGTLGPFIMLQQRYTDVTAGSFAGFTSSNTIVFAEDGNPGINSSIGFSNGFGRLSDGSNDGIAWNYARLVMRGVSLNTGTSNASVVLQPFAVQSSTGVVTTQSSFTATDNGSDRGYTTWISPWFSTNIVNDIQSLGIKALTINGATGGNVRIGTTYLQFKA